MKIKDVYEDLLDRDNNLNEIISALFFKALHFQEGGINFSYLKEIMRILKIEELKDCLTWKQGQPLVLIDTDEHKYIACIEFREKESVFFLECDHWNIKLNHETYSLSEFQEHWDKDCFIRAATLKEIKVCRKLNIDNLDEVDKKDPKYILGITKLYNRMEKFKNETQKSDSQDA